MYTLIRFCLLLAFVLAPVLAKLLGSLAHRLVGGAVSFGSIAVDLPGSRLALWFGGLVIIIAGGLSAMALRTTESARDARG